jgi:hypothetical protein
MLIIDSRETGDSSSFEREKTWERFINGFSSGTIWFVILCSPPTHIQDNAFSPSALALA